MTFVSDVDSDIIALQSVLRSLKFKNLCCFTKQQQITILGHQNYLANFIAFIHKAGQNISVLQQNQIIENGGEKHTLQLSFTYAFRTFTTEALSKFANEGTSISNFVGYGERVNHNYGARRNKTTLRIPGVRTEAAKMSFRFQGKLATN